MKIRPFLVTAAAGVVAAMVVPSFAHAWLSAAASGAEPVLAAGASQQAQPPGTRRLSPSDSGSAPLPRGGAPAPGDAPQDVAPRHSADQGRAQEGVPDLATLLREPDLALREQHFEALVARAADEPAVRHGLEALTAGSDIELAWTARLALREVRTKSASPLRARVLDPFAEIERMFGKDPFDDPLFARPFRGFGRAPFAPPQPGGPGADEDPFARMRSELRRLEELVAPRSNDWLAPRSTPAPRAGAHFQGRSESLSVTPDGVRLEVEEDGPDGRTSRTYEARSLEELYSAHPELRPGKR